MPLNDVNVMREALESAYKHIKEADEDFVASDGRPHRDHVILEKISEALK